MATVALSDLIQTQTKDQIVSTHLQLLAIAGLPTTSWQSGSVPLSLIQASAQTLSDVTTQIANIAAGGLIDSANGGYLDLIAQSHYRVTRKAAVTTQGQLVLTDTGGGGPYTITSSQLYAGPASGGLRYINVDAGVLPKNGSLTLTWQAESPGAAYNLANNTITSLLTPLPGVTVTNPDNGSGSWITLIGTDAESDTSLRTRCSQKWSLLSGSATVGTYQYWAVTSTPTVTRANVVENSPSPGKVQIYIAGSTGASPSTDVTSVNTYIQPLRPLCVTVTVTAATNTTIAIAASVTCSTTLLTAAQTTFQSNLTAYTQGLAIGGTVYVSKIVDLIQSIVGVRNVSVTLPAADVALSANQVAVFDTSAVTWTGV